MEIGVEYSVAREDVNAFERYMAMLKTYYMDYADKLEESPKKYELLGLNLLRLLSQNETAKFHTEIELLDPLTIQENPYISCPVKLEQDIMEGSYKKVSSVLVKFYSRNIKKHASYKLKFLRHTIVWISCIYFSGHRFHLQCPSKNIQLFHVHSVDHYSRRNR